MLKLSSHRFRKEMFHHLQLTLFPFSFFLLALLLLLLLLCSSIIIMIILIFLIIPTFFFTDIRNTITKDTAHCRQARITKQVYYLLVHPVGEGHTEAKSGPDVGVSKPSDES